jgi:hypothetical protein
MSTSTTPAPYPILANLSLKGSRGIVGRNRERLKDIPTQRAGIGLVLDVDGVAHEVEDGTPLRKAHGIGSASAVLLVDLRRRRVEVDLTLPSAEPHRDFSATAVFHCQVRSATAVVQEQVGELEAELAGWATEIVRRRSRAVSPERTAELEAIGRTMLASATTRAPLVPATTIAIKLASFEVHVSEDQRTLLREADARRREAQRREHLVRAEHERQQLAAELAHERSLREDYLATSAIPAKTELALKQNELEGRKKIDEFGWQEAIGEQAGRVQAQQEERKWDRRQRSAARYEEALSRGPEALMALFLAEEPGRVTEVLHHQLQSKEALYGLLAEVTRSPHVHGSALEPFAKHLVDVVGQQLEIGPGFAPPQGLNDGGAWGEEAEGDDPDADDGSARAAADDPFDPDSLINAEVVDDDDADGADGGGGDGGDSGSGGSQEGPTDGTDPVAAGVDPATGGAKDEAP